MHATSTTTHVLGKEKKNISKSKKETVQTNKRAKMLVSKGILLSE